MHISFRETTNYMIIFYMKLVQSKHLIVLLFILFDGLLMRVKLTFIV